MPPPGFPWRGWRFYLLTALRVAIMLNFFFSQLHLKLNLSPTISASFLPSSNMQNCIIRKSCAQDQKAGITKQISFCASSISSSCARTSTAASSGDLPLRSSELMVILYIGINLLIKFNFYYITFYKKCQIRIVYHYYFIPFLHFAS